MHCRWKTIQRSKSGRRYQVTVGMVQCGDSPRQKRSRLSCWRGGSGSCWISCESFNIVRRRERSTKDHVGCTECTAGADRTHAQMRFSNPCTLATLPVRSVTCCCTPRSRDFLPVVSQQPTWLGRASAVPSWDGSRVWRSSQVQSRHERRSRHRYAGFNRNGSRTSLRTISPMVQRERAGSGEQGNRCGSGCRGSSRCGTTEQAA